VPRSSKWWIWFAIVWFVSPIDLIPEFIPVAGPLDDAIVAALVLRHVLKRTDRQVLSDHWRGDPATLDIITRARANKEWPPDMPIEIGLEDVQRLVRDEHAALLDVLPEQEFNEEHLPGAVNIPLKKLTAEAVADLARDRAVIAYCHDDT
jgi:uncharacterized membrane protein YkvA (DUF1232 family)